MKCLMISRKDLKASYAVWRLLMEFRINNVALNNTIIFHRVLSLFFPSSVFGQLQCWCSGCPVGNGGNGAGRLSHGEKAGDSAAQVVCRIQVRSTVLSAFNLSTFRIFLINKIVALETHPDPHLYFQIRLFIHIFI
jgi:hypothetical protein